MFKSTTLITLFFICSSLLVFFLDEHCPLLNAHFSQNLFFLPFFLSFFFNLTAKYAAVASHFQYATLSLTKVHVLTRGSAPAD